MNRLEQRLNTNRSNAERSTGPVTQEGKAVSSRNATRHGLLSERLLLDDEDPSAFDTLISDLTQSLNPVGAMEATLVERIAVSLWRQRRLVQAETASLTLARQARKIASGVSSELGRGFGSELKTKDLAPFDPDREQWCRAAKAEIEALGSHDPEVIEKTAPLVWEQLVSDAEGDRQTVPQFLAGFEGGPVGFISNLREWCQDQLSKAEKRPHILALAEQVRTKRLVLPAETLELLARYQSTLDNQIYKALRALREAQDWRLKTLELQSTVTASQSNGIDGDTLAVAA